MSDNRPRSPRAPRGRPSAWLLALRAGRKVLVSTIGAILTVVGIILLPLPGPGMLVVGLGLALLSTEYRWPRRLALRLRTEAEVWRGRLRDRRAARHPSEAIGAQEQPDEGLRIDDLTPPRRSERISEG